MCYNPITVKNPRTGHYHQVPCGKCLECKKQYQMSWAARLSEEFVAHNFVACMLTLTYDERSVPKNYIYRGQVFRSRPYYNYDNTGEVLGRGGRRIHACKPWQSVYDLNPDIASFGVRNEDSDLSEDYQDEEVLKWGIPDYLDPFDIRQGFMYNGVVDDNSIEHYQSGRVVAFNSVRKEDVIFFIDRFRKKCKKEFTWYCTSEYGPATQRPHYHLIFFGLTTDEVRPLAIDWSSKFGKEYTLKDVYNEGGFTYVAKYCSKGSFEHPLCSKSEIKLVNGVYEERFHKNYLHNLKYFDLDCPVVDPTFHLMSKSIGKSFIHSHAKYYLSLVQRESFPLDLCEQYQTVTFNGSFEELYKVKNYLKYTFKIESQDKHKEFTIALPRYYYERIFPKVVRQQIGLSAQMANDKLYDDTLFDVATEMSDRTDGEIITEAISRLHPQDEYETRFRSSFKTLNRWYKNSKV